MAFKAASAGLGLMCHETNDDEGFGLETVVMVIDAYRACIAFLSTQLAANLITILAGIGAGLVYVRQSRHANHVRDLTFIANQQQILISLSRALVGSDETAAYDVAALLATMEQTAHAFNTRLVGPIAVDYLRPEFLKLIDWSMRHPGVRHRWSASKQDEFCHLRSFISKAGYVPPRVEPF